MNNTINTLNNIFAKLKERPDKSDDISKLIRDNLNSMFEDEEIKCNKVFISEGNGSNPFYVSVIPNRPDNKILKKKFLKEYDIDIDLSSFESNYNKNGFTVNEMTAWLIHELASNILTDETFLRFKKLIVKYYDTKNGTILDTIDAYGTMLWIGVFSRTKMDFSDKLTNVNIILNKFGLSEYWESALFKYISSNGGDSSIITDEYINRMDRVQLRKFNELARKYASYSLKYNNTDYSTMVKYIINSTKSELVKYYISKEPQSVPTYAEKMVYVLFDDTKLLLEAIGNEEDIYSEIKIVDILDKLEELTIDINNIKSESDKLLCSAKLKELSKIIDYKYTNCDITMKDQIQRFKYDIETLITKLGETETSEKVSVQELQ